MSNIKRPVDSINDYHWKNQTIKHGFLTQGTLDLLNESDKKMGVSPTAGGGAPPLIGPSFVNSPYQKRIKPDFQQASPYKNNVLLYQVVLEKDADMLLN